MWPKSFWSNICARIPFLGYKLLESQRHFLFYIHEFFFLGIGIYSINNVVIISGEQYRGSALLIYVPILPQTPFPSRLPHSIEQGFHVLHSRSLMVIHFKYSSLYMSVPNSLSTPSPFFFYPGNHKFIL